jgi:hypothetical protein
MKSSGAAILRLKNRYGTKEATPLGMAVTAVLKQFHRGSITCWFIVPAPMLGTREGRVQAT